MIPVIIPMKDGHYIPRSVLLSLAKQEPELVVVPITRPQKEEDFPIDAHPLQQEKMHGRLAQAENRNIGAQRVLKDFPFADTIYMQDCTVQLFVGDVIKRGLSILESDPNIGVVYFNVKHESPISKHDNHLPLTSMLIRKGVLETVSFHTEDPRHCSCLNFLKDLKQSQWKHEVIPERVGRDLKLGNIVWQHG